MDVEELREARVLDYIDNILVQGQQYKYVIESRLGIAIGAEDLRVLIVEWAVFVWKQLLLRRILDGTTFRAPFAGFCSIPSAAQVRSPTYLAVPPVLTALATTLG